MLNKTITWKILSFAAAVMLVVSCSRMPEDNSIHPERSVDESETSESMDIDIEGAVFPEKRKKLSRSRPMQMEKSGR